MALQVAEGTISNSTALYNFIQNPKRGGEAVREFAIEVEALGTACYLVNRRVKTFVRDKAEDEGAIARRRCSPSALELQLVDCGRTVEQLQEAITCTDAEAVESSGMFKKAVRQIKLNLKATDIATARNLFRSHTSSLQLILHCVAIDVSYVKPQRVDGRFTGYVRPAN
jgi:hypothetical protein